MTRWMAIGLIALGIGISSLGARGPARDDHATDEPSGPQTAEETTVTGGASGLDADPDELSDKLLDLIDQPLRWHSDYETVLALARRSDKPIFVRFR